MPPVLDLASQVFGGQVKRFGCTAFSIIHDLESACTIGDGIAILREGRIVLRGPA